MGTLHDKYPAVYDENDVEYPDWGARVEKLTTKEALQHATNGALGNRMRELMIQYLTTVIVNDSYKLAQFRDMLLHSNGALTRFLDWVEAQK